MFNEHIESVFIEIDRSKLNVEKNVIIGVIYRPPNTDIEIFNEYLWNILDKVGHEKKTVIYRGCLKYKSFELWLTYQNGIPCTVSHLYL